MNKKVLVQTIQELVDAYEDWKKRLQVDAKAKKFFCPFCKTYAGVKNYEELFGKSHYDEKMCAKCPNNVKSELFGCLIIRHPVYEFVINCRITQLHDWIDAIKAHKGKISLKKATELQKEIIGL